MHFISTNIGTEGDILAAWIRYFLLYGLDPAMINSKRVFLGDICQGDEEGDAWVPGREEPGIKFLLEG